MWFVKTLSTVRGWWAQENDKRGEHSQSSTSQAKWCQLYPAGKCYKLLTVQSLARLQEFSSTSGRGKADLTTLCLGQVDRNPRRLASIAQDQIECRLLASFFAFGQKNPKTKTKQTHL